jgi:taspase, threonine aspartase, 1
MAHLKSEKTTGSKGPSTTDSATSTEPWMYTDMEGPSTSVAPMPDSRAVFVHAGAGYHSQQNEPVHLKACAEYVPNSYGHSSLTECSACKAAMALLRKGGSATDAVEMAIKVLEDNEITNAGYGSNLNVHGDPEMDAVICEGTGMSGAVAAVRGK